MVVTDIIEVTKAKSRVFLDGEFAFVLYKGELRLFKIRKGEEISHETVQEILHVILPKRAKKRLLMLLQKKDYTEEELRRKLADGEYPSKVIEEAITYVKSYHYIDDDRYCRAYINCYSSKWSRQQITAKLMVKGVGKDRIQSVFEKMQQNGELEDTEEKLIWDILRKKHYDPLNADYIIRRKMYQHLAYKGFSSDKIRKALGDVTYEY